MGEQIVRHLGQKWMEPVSTILSLSQDSQPWILTHHMASNNDKRVFKIRKGEFMLQYYFKLTLIIKNKLCLSSVGMLEPQLRWARVV